MTTRRRVARPWLVLYLVIGIGCMLSASPVLADSITPTSLSCTIAVGGSCGFTKSVSVYPFVGAYWPYSSVGLEVPTLAGLGIAVVPTAFVGNFDRSIQRTFMFDVTFTGLAPGEYVFSIYGLVDGVRVATENDVITVLGTEPPQVPEPASLLLLGTGLVGLARWRRRKN